MLACYRKRGKPAPPVTTFTCGREVCSKTKAGKEEYIRRREEMELRQDFKCAICKRVFLVMTFDHEGGRGHGGGLRDDRIIDAKGNWMNAALCGNCNTFKASRRYSWVNGEYQPLEWIYVCNPKTILR